MRSQIRRMGLALALTVLTATVIVLVAEQVSTKSAKHQSNAPAALTVDVGSDLRRITPAEVERDPTEWHSLVGDHSN